MRASSVSALARTRTGAATDTAPSTDALAGMGALLPVVALGAAGAVFAGTLWGMYGLLGGAIVGAGAGYGVTKLAAKKPESKGPPPPTPADFTVPQPGNFTPPANMMDIPKIPFPDKPTFMPTPSLWFPVSVVSSRSRVGEHRDLSEGSYIEFIAQYGYHSIEDTSNEIKLGGVIRVSRNALEDRDPAYGVEVVKIVQEHDVDGEVVRPAIGQRMVVAPDQVLLVSTEGEALWGPGGGTSAGAFEQSKLPPWMRHPGRR